MVWRIRTVRGSWHCDEKEVAMVPRAVTRAIEAVPELTGGFAGRSGAEVLAEAKEFFRGAPTEGPLAEVTALWEMAQGGTHDELGDVLRIDLGEVRHFPYYTGINFHAVAPGPANRIHQENDTTICWDDLVIPCLPWVSLSISMHWLGPAMPLGYLNIGHVACSWPCIREDPPWSSGRMWKALRQ